MKHFKVIAISTIVLFSLITLKTHFYPSKNEKKAEDVVAVKQKDVKKKQVETKKQDNEKRKNSEKEEVQKKQEIKKETKNNKVKSNPNKKKAPSTKTKKTTKEKTNKPQNTSTQANQNKQKEVKTSKTKTITKNLNYKTETIYDDTVEDGVKKIVQKGSNGKIVSQITEHYTNNRLVSKEEKVIENRQPVNEKVLIGTKKIEAKPEQNNYDNSLEREVFNLVNAARRAEGLSPLSWNDRLHKAARIRAEEIVSNFSHTRPNGQEWYSVAPNLALGENIAYGQSSAQHVHNSWMNSEGHKANILKGSFNSIGVGLYITESGQKYWVQLFA